MQITDEISTLEVFGFTVLASVLAALASAWLTTRFALHRFRAEKGWEKRIEAYERIIQSLHESKSACNELLIYESRGTEPSEERNTELAVMRATANREVERAIDLGAFLLMDKALKCLKGFQNDMRRASNTNSWTQHLVENYDALHACLQEFVEIARDDLKLSRS